MSLYCLLSDFQSGFFASWHGDITSLWNCKRNLDQLSAEETQALVIELGSSLGRIQTLIDRLEVVWRKKKIPLEANHFDKLNFYHILYKENTNIYF